MTIKKQEIENLSSNKFLAIDIGLRNLAMCVMSANDKSNLETFNIHLWDVFDTIEDSEEFLCKSIQKNGKICNKKCLYKYKHENEIVYTCKKHFPKNITIEKSNKVIKKAINDYLLQDIAKKVLYKLQYIYDTYPIFKELTNIIIELQPKINQKMKFTSHIVYGKLVELYKDSDVTIRFVRASTKLKAYTGPPIECKLKGAYAKRKWLSIQYCKWIIENKFSKEISNKWLKIFETHKKLDDMMDTCLMAINALHGVPKSKDKNGRCIK